MKTKNLFLGVLAMTGMLFATSCSQDEVLNGSSNANLVNATFTINSPEGIATRAIGEADYVNKVVCATYDEDGVELTDLRQYLDVKEKAAQYSIRLVKGQNYRVAFFAYCAADGSNAPIHYDVTDLKNIKVLDAQSSNVEKRDAFTAYTDIKTGETMQPINRTVTLYRPFAQLNFGSETEDWNAAVSAGVEVVQTKVIVSNVYKTFSAYDDEVVGDAEAMTFALNDIPAQDLSANGKVYKYLAMNYLLVGDAGCEKTLTDVTLEWLGKDGETNDPVTVFKNIPVQRNYRTNIIGYLLTNPAKFNIVVDEAFEKPDYNNEITGLVKTSAQLTEAFKNGGVITLGGDIVLDEQLIVAENAEVYLDMNGKTITVNNTSAADPVFYSYKGSTLTITGNGTVEINDPSLRLMFPGGDVVIENGTFTRNVPDGTPANQVGSFFIGAKVSPWGSQTVTIKGGYFDGGYYDANAADIDEYLAGTKTLTETADDIAKRGIASDKNIVRVALKNNVMKLLNLSANLFKVQGGTFVGANPAWGDEGCMLPTTPNYLRPWSYYQGALIEGQTFNENGIVLPAGYEITKGATADGRPTYTVTYNE